MNNKILKTSLIFLIHALIIDQFHFRFKDGEELKADDRLQLTALPDGTVKLFIQECKPSDCGAYKLVAKNPNGETSALCAVAINRKKHLSISLTLTTYKNKMLIKFLHHKRIFGHNTGKILYVQKPLF